MGGKMVRCPSVHSVFWTPPMGIATRVGIATRTPEHSFLFSQCSQAAFNAQQCACSQACTAPVYSVFESSLWLSMSNTGTSRWLPSSQKLRLPICTGEHCHSEGVAWGRSRPTPPHSPPKGAPVISTERLWRGAARSRDLTAGDALFHTKCYQRQ